MRPSGPALFAGVRERARIPLYRNGYALIASSGVTSVLGLVYWVVAARLYDTAAVGVGAAVIAAMTLLANLAQLNLKSALNRFLPVAGEASAAMVARAYLVALGLAGLASVTFLAGLSVWAPDLAFLTDRPLLAAWFVVSTMAWTIFVLQDSALAGLRQAAWVPAENLAFSVAKLVLLVVAAGSAPILGAFVSWTIATLLLVGPVTWLLFARLVPRHVSATRGRQQPVHRRDVVRYVAADYVAYGMWTVTIGALPLVVLQVAGAEANARFFVAWSIAYALYLASSGMCQSLLAEAALVPDRADELAGRALRETLVLVSAGAVAIVVAAPAILRVAGEDYGGDTVTLLRLLAVSAVPYVVVAVHVNVARAQRRMRTVIATYAAVCGLVFAIGLPLLHGVGIQGVGIAWLVAQSTVAGVLLCVRLARSMTLLELTDRVEALLCPIARPLETRVLRSLVHALGERHGTGWSVHRMLALRGGKAVTEIGPAIGAGAVVKRARNVDADAAVERETEALLRLAGHRSADVPRVLASGRAGGRAFLAQTRLPGAPAGERLAHGLTVEQLLRNAERALRPLHGASARRVRLDDALLAQLVDEPLAILAGAVAPRADATEALACLAAELRESLVGCEVELATVHGDLWADNLLVGADGTVTGIIDWENASELGLARVDLMHLLITLRASTERRELGAVVADMLNGPLRASRGAEPRTHLLLAWLGGVAGSLRKTGRFGRHGPWMRRNIDPVLAAVAGDGVMAVATPRSLARRAVLPGSLLAAGLALWLLSLPSVDLRAMTDTGLVSVLPVTFFAALAALTAGFVTLMRRGGSLLLPGVLLVALVAMLHATPALLYDTLRYSWAWKHVGVVDYVERHDAVQTHATYLPVYHNWPGFFGLDALLTNLAGAAGAAGHAIWGPLFFNLMALGALIFVFSALTRDRRVVALGCWLYFLASWVGQDYYSPQALTFTLYLVLLGVVLHWLRDERRWWAVGVALLLVAAIVVTHPLTAVMTVIALTALTACRACAVRWLPVAALAMTAVWNLTFAAPYAGQERGSVLDSIRLPWQTTESSLQSTEQLSDGQVVVALAGRGLSAMIAGLAVIGGVWLVRRGGLERAAVVLAVAPAALFAAGDYEGEVLFRIYLFALPFLAFHAAHAFGSWQRWWSGAALGAATAVLLTAFSLAYYGKEHQYYFTPAEVEASRYVFAHAPAGSLLIEGTRNYPGQWKNYERFDYVTIAREPNVAASRLLRHPAQTLQEWMSDPRYAAAYLIITRSQKIEEAELGALPRGSLARIERALAASPAFRAVVRNRDATVFTLARRDPG